MWQPLLKKLKNCFTTVRQAYVRIWIVVFIQFKLFALTLVSLTCVFFRTFCLSGYYILVSSQSVSHSPQGPQLQLYCEIVLFDKLFNIFTSFSLVWFFVYDIRSVCRLHLLPTPHLDCLSCCLCSSELLPLVMIFDFFKHILCCCTSLRIALGLEIHCGQKDWAPTGDWITHDSKPIANNIELMLDKRA